jgi:hypothetical protein
MAILLEFAALRPSWSHREGFRMLDYLTWTERARTFLRGLAWLPGKVELCDDVEPPGQSDRDRRAYLRSQRCSLPPEIRQFVGSASQHCSFFYRWSPSADWRPRLHSVVPGIETVKGGADLCEVIGYDLYDGRNEYRKILESVPIPASFIERVGLTKERGRFLQLAPLTQERELVLDLEPLDGHRGVGCVSVANPNDFQRFSVSFDRFLADWETICYLAPDPETLGPWLDPQSGLLNPDPEKARNLRTLFREASQH